MEFYMLAASDSRQRFVFIPLGVTDNTCQPTLLHLHLRHSGPGGAVEALGGKRAHRLDCSDVSKLCVRLTDLRGQKWETPTEKPSVSSGSWWPEDPWRTSPGTQEKSQNVNKNCCSCKQAHREFFTGSFLRIKTKL